MSIRTQTLLIVTSLLAAAVLATAGVLGWTSRQALLAQTEAQGLVIVQLLARSSAFGAQVMNEVEGAIGEQMVVEATMAAHLVALGEAAGVSPQTLNRHLGQIADSTMLDEIWITDEHGHAYLHNIPEIDFTFSPDAKAQPQAHAFWPLLMGKDKVIAQKACPREVDSQVFKYVGVTGVDKPRIVQVGYNASFLQNLRQRMGLTRLVQQLVFEGSVVAVRVLDSNMATVAYANRLDGDKLPEPAAADPAGVRRLVSEGRTESTLENSFLKITAPIGEEGGELKGGAILVTLPTDRLRAAIRGQTRLAVAISAIVLLLGSLIATFGARRISRPIADLTEMTRRIAGGDLEQSIDIRSSNELGTLAASFNEMTRRLNESIEHLKETTAANERIQSELDIAHDMQMSMVPKVFPPFPERSEFDVFASLVPAREVGGDLYDFFFIDDDHLCFAVADVSGKGVPAALFMAATRALFRAIVGKGRTAGEILARLNTEICRDNDSCMFVTLFCGILDVRSGRLEYSNAGHTLPYRLRADRAEPLENIGGMALGIVEKSPYESGRIVLGPGEALVLYSDGVTEAMDASQAFYSDERLESFLCGHLDSGPCQIAGELVASVRSFAGKAPQSDDITVLALRYFGVAEKMKEVLEIKLANRHSELDRFNEALTEFSARKGLSAKVTHDLTLALEEIITNIISYGFCDEHEHEISVRLRAEPGEVSVEVEDDGHPFNPLEAPQADTTLSLEERQIGGLGIHLVRKLMTGLEYKRQGDRNLLSISKRT